MGRKKQFQWYDSVIINWTISDLSRTVNGLLQRIEEAPPSSIHFHTHHTYLVRPFVGSLYFNDFANWAYDHLKEFKLAERLSMILPSQYRTVEDLREGLIHVLENYLAEIGTEYRLTGLTEPFVLMDARIENFPSGPKASSLEEWIEQFKDATIYSIYTHFYEIHWYADKDKEKFSPVNWLRDLGEDKAADIISSFDPFAWNIYEFRNDLLKELSGFVKRGSSRKK